MLQVELIISSEKHPRNIKILSFPHQGVIDKTIILLTTTKAQRETHYDGHRIGLFIKHYVTIL